MTLTEWLNQEHKKPSAFAREIGRSHTTVIRWLSGASVPSPQAMRLVLKLTGGAVTPIDLIGKEAQ